jgi:DNA polymerase-3 subunit epsilon
MEAYRRFLRERDGRLRTALVGAAAPAIAAAAVADVAGAGGGRAAAIAWARTVAADPDAVYVDTETTGCATHDEVIEIAVVGNDGRALFETLLKPARPIPPAVIAVHGITDADVAHAPRLPEVAAELRRWLDGRVVVVYNAPFDRRLIAQSCERYGLPTPLARYDCAMRRYAAFAAVARANGRGHRWHKLEQAVRAFGQPPGGHRAAADALATRHVVHGMAGADERRETRDESR